MNDHAFLLRPDAIRLGWALVHFLWQGVLIAGVLAVALRLAGPKQASLRYLMCGLALMAMPLCLIETYTLLGGETFSSRISAVPNPELAAKIALPVPSFVNFVWLPTQQSVTAFATRTMPLEVLNRWMPGIVAAWLVGVILLTGRKAGGFYVLSCLRRNGVSEPDESLVDLFHQACGRIGINPRRVSLKLSALVPVPMTMGCLRPLVLFPVALLTGLSAVEIELLLAHELAHIRRHDYLTNLLQTVVETLFFYHPATWWISRRMRQEREHRCDDLVAARPGDVLPYAKALLQLETSRLPETSLASAANGGSLRQRITRLVGKTPPASGGLPLLALISFFGITISLALVRAEMPPASQPSPMTAAEAKKQGVAAMVNQHPILESEVDRQVNHTGHSVISGVPIADLQNRQKVLQTLIERELIIEDFKSSGGFIPKSYTDQRVDDIVKEQYGGDRKSFLQTIDERGLSLGKYREEIEDNAVVGYMRHKMVSEKVRLYYLAHPDLFPQDARVSVTLLQFRGSQPAQMDKDGNHPSASDTGFETTKQILRQLRQGSDVTALAKKYHADGQYNGEPVWLTKDMPAGWPAWWPFSWADVEKLKPGETTDVGIAYGDYAQGNGASQTYPYYYILRLNERRPARIPATKETTEQKETLLSQEATHWRDIWFNNLRSKAKIQIFDSP